MPVAAGSYPAREGARRIDGRALPIMTLVALAVLVVVLASGVWLMFFYRPIADPRGFVLASGESGTVRLVRAVRAVHRISSLALIPALLGVLVGAIADRRLIRWPRVVSAAVAVPIALAAGFTGRLLPWDQLALWAVTVGSRFEGYRWLWDGEDQVRFVIVGGSEISATTVGWALAAHVGLALGVVVALVVVGLRRSRTRDHLDHLDPHAPEPPDATMAVAVDG